MASRHHESWCVSTRKSIAEKPAPELAVPDYTLGKERLHLALKDLGA